MFESVTFAHEGQAEAIVLGLFEGKTLSEPAHPLFELPAVRAALERPEWSGEADNLIETFVTQDGPPQRIYLMGLGKPDKFKPGVLRKTAAKLARRLAQTKEQIVRVELAHTLQEQGADVEQCGRCFGESVGLLAWRGRQYQGSGSKEKTLLPLSIQCENEAFASGLRYGLELAASVNLARDLSQTPPNIATPLWMAEQAQKLAQETGLLCTVLKGDDLNTHKLEGLITVGGASIHPPCLIRLEYRPEGQATDKETEAGKPPVVLLGKTVTYDTGGLSLKVNNGMLGMKRDKDGGCAVLGAMRAVANLIRPDFPVVGLLTAAENSVSEASMRPDDIVTYRNGVTVEITNTDAEGRLVLADGLCWACDEEKASLIVDLATLTGGVVTALGSVYAGLFCEDDTLRTSLEQAGERSGERVWRLPMDEEYREMMKSSVADILNSSAQRGKAHPIQGAAFLSWFVKEGTPWAHIDIAGVHAVEADQGPFIKGPTGYGVRLLAELVSSMNSH